MDNRQYCIYCGTENLCKTCLKKDLCFQEFYGKCCDVGDTPVCDDYETDGTVWMRN